MSNAQQFGHNNVSQYQDERYGKMYSFNSNQVNGIYPGPEDIPPEVWRGFQNSNVNEAVKPLVTTFHNDHKVAFEYGDALDYMGSKKVWIQKESIQGRSKTKQSWEVVNEDFVYCPTHNNVVLKPIHFDKEVKSGQYLVSCGLCPSTGKGPDFVGQGSQSSLNETRLIWAASYKQLAEQSQKELKAFHTLKSVGSAEFGNPSQPNNARNHVLASADMETATAPSLRHGLAAFNKQNSNRNMNSNNTNNNDSSQSNDCEMMGSSYTEEEKVAELLPAPAAYDEEKWNLSRSYDVEPGDYDANALSTWSKLYTDLLTINTIEKHNWHVYTNKIFVIGMNVKRTRRRTDEQKKELETHQQDADSRGCLHTLRDFCHKHNTLGDLYPWKNLTRYNPECGKCYMRNDVVSHKPVQATQNGAAMIAKPQALTQEEEDAFLAKFVQNAQIEREELDHSHTVPSDAQLDDMNPVFDHRVMQTGMQGYQENTNMEDIM